MAYLVRERRQSTLHTTLCVMFLGCFINVVIKMPVLIIVLYVVKLDICFYKIFYKMHN